jgi:hypothetical protein
VWLERWGCKVRTARRGCSVVFFFEKVKPREVEGKRKRKEIWLGLGLGFCGFLTLLLALQESALRCFSTVCSRSLSLDTPC